MCQTTVSGELRKVIRGTVEKDFAQTAVVSEHVAISVLNENVVQEPADLCLHCVFGDCAAVINGWHKRAHRGSQ